MNSLFDEEIRGHHSMRDHLLTLVTDADLAFELPGQNPTLGGLLIELGDIQGVYTHSFATLTLDWATASFHPRPDHDRQPASVVQGTGRRHEQRAGPLHAKRNFASIGSTAATASSPRPLSSTRFTARRSTSSTAS